ncbi:MAG: type II toxin-antitoxin system HicB family antitoxin [Candidatus Moranbacteria bacterium]|nr:type II toxin-antitoxin system HicB family antitoxin [Candidatus Moranbacteria bacterium]
MKNIKYIVYKEGKYFVSQCLNVEVSSFGDSIDEAVFNLKEALELYYEDDSLEESYIPIDEVMIGERKEIPVGTFHSILKQSDLKQEDFIE